jgi:hypothetical protein
LSRQVQKTFGTVCIIIGIVFCGFHKSRASSSIL